VPRVQVILGITSARSLQISPFEESFRVAVPANLYL